MQRQLDLRPPLAEVAQYRRQHGPQYVVDETNRKPPDRTIRRRSGAAHGLICPTKKVTRLRQKYLAGNSESNVVARALQQRKSELFFEQLQLMAHR
jgi:hypothetical protein